MHGTPKSTVAGRFYPDYSFPRISFKPLILNLGSTFGVFARAKLAAYDITDTQRDRLKADFRTHS